MQEYSASLLSVARRAIGRRAATEQVSYILSFSCCWLTTAAVACRVVCSVDKTQLSSTQLILCDYGSSKLVSSLCETRPPPSLLRSTPIPRTWFPVMRRPSDNPHRISSSINCDINDKNTLLIHPYRRYYHDDPDTRPRAPQDQTTQSHS